MQNAFIYIVRTDSEPKSIQDCPWHTRELGFVDTPNAIQCRVCDKIKPNTALHFRPVKYGMPLVTTCRACERKGRKGRTALGLAEQILARPGGWTPEERVALLKREMPALRAAQHKRRSEGQRLTHRRDFELQWKKVRAAIAARRLMLDARCRLQKWAGPDDALAPEMADYPDVVTYLRLVLQVYKAIVTRLSARADWFDVIGGHLPMAVWCVHPRDTSALMAFCPWMFTTRDERVMCQKALPPLMRWYTLSPRMQGNGSTFLRHAVPWQLADPEQLWWHSCPDWLREFNGAPRE